MKQELEQRIMSRWPRWFDGNGDTRRTLMSWGFCHDDGWIDLLWRLFEDLEPLVGEWERHTGHTFQILQVKEKFGGLRVYAVSEARAAICERIEAAERESYYRCELCGGPGTLPRGFFKTLCELHEKAGRC
jgi:hypothetical protein